MKRFLCLILLIIFVCSLCACSKPGEVKPVDNNQATKEDSNKEVIIPDNYEPVDESKDDDSDIDRELTPAEKEKLKKFILTDEQAIEKVDKLFVPIQNLMNATFPTDVNDTVEIEGKVYERVTSFETPKEFKDFYFDNFDFEKVLEYINNGNFCDGNNSGKVYQIKNDNVVIIENPEYKMLKNDTYDIEIEVTVNDKSYIYKLETLDDKWIVTEFPSIK